MIKRLNGKSWCIEWRGVCWVGVKAAFLLSNQSVKTSNLGTARAVKDGESVDFGGANGTRPIKDLRSSPQKASRRSFNGRRTWRMLIQESTSSRQRHRRTVPPEFSVRLANKLWTDAHLLTRAPTLWRAHSLQHCLLIIFGCRSINDPRSSVM